MVKHNDDTIRHDASDGSRPLLVYYKVAETVRDPVVKTAGSACFDIPISLRDGFDLKVWFWKNTDGGTIQEEIVKLTNGKSFPKRMSNSHSAKNIAEGLTIHKGATFLVPTGLIFVIPDGYHVQIHLRSSTGLKKHLAIPSHIGIIDADYRDEVHVPLHCISETATKVFDGDMLAQAMLVKNTDFEMKSCPVRPERLDSRNGGFGSTGN